MKEERRTSLYTLLPLLNFFPDNLFFYGHELPRLQSRKGLGFSTILILYRSLPTDLSHGSSH